jgi:PTH2 family peptidyl-tRNA hydrolase
VFVGDDLKLVLLVRNDLGMSPGKIAAQCCHAALGAQRVNPMFLTNYE